MKKMSLEKINTLEKIAGAGKFSDFTPEEIWEFVRGRLPFFTNKQYHSLIYSFKEDGETKITLDCDISFFFGKDENFFDEYDDESMQAFCSFININKDKINNDIKEDLKSGNYSSAGVVGPLSLMKVENLDTLDFASVWCSNPDKQFRCYFSLYKKVNSNEFLTENGVNIEQMSNGDKFNAIKDIVKSYEN
jgi:hypothetical protein